MSDRPPSPPVIPATPTDPPARALWRVALGRLALVALLGAGAGWLFGVPAMGCSLALALYAGAQIRNLIRLRIWLRRPKHYELPESRGLWGEVFDGLLELQRKNRKKKKRLAAIVAEFQASTAALPDGAVVLGERGEISWFNNAARRLLGLRMPQDVGIRVPNLIRHPEFTAYFERGEFEREVEVPSPVNAAKTLSLRIIPYGQNQKLLIVRDISERQMLDAARRDFVANASHELRTPLTVLRGYLDMMEMDAQEQGPLAPWRVPIAEMRNQALRMEALVNDMLKLARLESGRAQMREELLDVPAMVQRAVEDGRRLSDGQHRFEADIDTGLLLYGGETELHSILTNLITNAVRYTPAGGAIRVSWTEVPGQGGRLCVADTGIGIAQQDIPRLTERFYRVDVGRSRASGGTGLGLSIVKHALEAFDGRLDIESEVGVGSTFSCIFPPQRITRRSSKPAAATSQ
ncbi:PAS/PAC sensor signal transduction histidine kinase [Fontimonas thermophila]|uniref:Phosphate regulon sensor protein PhoR n=1 Tax=Fontimonas thermophila TaxID=1076937 RepID=A0A1I2I257_9GAMM|nr:phosphate regulon sensor histidine kinase PhoR [Fontimonas thermophila]SFF34611.1 PAS/PAC sensor signal transduction histidine kinase [Fontimonas thermophila]